MSQIVVIGGPGTGQTHALGDNSSTVIGNAESAGIHIPAPDLGAEQCTVTRSAGKTVILNTHAAMPLMVNGDIIEGERPLNHGDMIMLGEVMLLYDEEVYDEADTASGNTGGAAATADAPSVDDPTIHHRQKVFSDADKMLQSLEQTSDPSKFLGSFFKVSSALGELVELAKLLPRILDIVFEVIPADRGTIVQLQAGGMLEAAASKLRGEAATAEDKVHPSRTIIRQVVEQREGVLTRDAMQDDRFNVGMSIVEQKIHAALCVPLIDHRTNEVLGVIHLDTTSTGRTFDKDHLKLLTGIAMQASLAIVNARLIDQVGESKRIERELEIANNIQMGLVPKEAPTVPGLSVAGVMIPAKEVGGDYYDFVQARDGRTFYIVVGDVSGKGVPAGLVMIMARCFFQALADGEETTKAIISELNHLLFKDTRRDMFMTMLVLAYDTQDQTIKWTGAGHEHLLIWRAAKQAVEELPSGGVPLGMRDGGDHFAQNTLQLEKGDQVLLYTDGVTEAVNPDGDMFDLEATAALFAKHAHSDAELVVKSVLKELQGFIGTAEQSDDITLVAFQKT